jgi:hypothetical protein
MLNNPIISDRYKLQGHILFCVLVGIVYAIVFGWSAHQSTADIVADAALSMCLLFVEDILLCNIYTYSIVISLNIYQSLSLDILYGIISLVAFVGVESLMIYYFFSHDFMLFTQTLPARIFCLALLYCIYRLYGYIISKSEEDDDSEDEEEQDEDLKEQVESTPASKDADVNPVPRIERITVKVGSKIKVIPIDDLVYLKAEDDYVLLVTAEGHWLKSETMKDYEASLPADKFVRVHRSYIVNIGKITKIERYGQKQLLQLVTGESLKISTSGYKVLREKLNL